MYYVFMLFYTFLHFKRRLFESASFNVKRQLLLFSVAKTDKLPLLYSIILRSRIMIYKSAFQRLKGVKIYKKIKKIVVTFKKIKKNKKLNCLFFYKIFSGGRTSLFQGTTGVCE